jgi:hypothetical protein
MNSTFPLLDLSLDLIHCILYQVPILKSKNLTISRYMRDVVYSYHESTCKMKHSRFLAPVPRKELLPFYWIEIHDFIQCYQLGLEFMLTFISNIHIPVLPFVVMPTISGFKSPIIDQIMCLYKSKKEKLVKAILINLGLDDKICNIVALDQRRDDIFKSKLLHSLVRHPEFTTNEEEISFMFLNTVPGDLFKIFYDSPQYHLYLTQFVQCKNGYSLPVDHLYQADRAAVINEPDVMTQVLHLMNIQDLYYIGSSTITKAIDCDSKECFDYIISIAFSHIDIAVYIHSAMTSPNEYYMCVATNSSRYTLQIEGSIRKLTDHLENRDIISTFNPATGKWVM